MIESLASPEVVAALVTAVGGIVCALIKFWPKRSSHDEPALASTMAMPVQNGEALSANLSATIPSTALGYRQIAAAIDTAPPFQRDGIHQTFVGLQVKWLARLQSISRIGKGILASVNLVENDALVFCDVRPEDCVGIECAQEGSLVIVIGQIKRISTYEGALENCKITIATQGEGFQSKATNF